MPKAIRQTRLNHWTKNERKTENQWGNLECFNFLNISDFITETSFKFTVDISNVIATNIYFHKLML